MKKSIINASLIALCYGGNITLVEETSDFYAASGGLESGWHWGFNKAHADEDCTDQTDPSCAIEVIPVVGQPEPTPYIPPPVAPGNPGDQGDDGSNNSGSDNGGNEQPNEPTYTDEEIRECKDTADSDEKICKVRADQRKNNYNQYCEQYYEWYEETGDPLFKEEARHCNDDKEHNHRMEYNDCYDRWVWDRDYCEGLNNP